MVALKRGVLAAFLCSFSALAAGQTVPSMQDATLPLTDQEFLFISQNGQPRRVHPSAITPTGLVVPTADLLGGANNAFTQVTVGSNLNLSSGVLSAPIPTASLLGGSSNTFTQIGLGTGLQIGSGNLSLTDTAVTPGTYTNTTLTVDQQGRLTAASSGAAGCSGITVGAVLFSDGSTCVGDQPHLAWDDTNFSLTVTGNSSVLPFGRIASTFLGGNDNCTGAAEFKQTAGGGKVSVGHCNINNYGSIAGYDAANSLERLVINPGQATVSIGTSLGGFVNQPAEFANVLIDPGGNSRWWTVLGLSADFRGGLYANSSGHASLRLWDTGAAEKVLISADSADVSKVPGRFQAVGLRDTTVTTCTVVSTDGSGNLICGGTGAITGSGTAGKAAYWSSPSVLASAGVALPTAPASTQCLHIDSSGNITATGSDCNTGGGGGATGLYSWSLSATPTASSTGLSTWVHQNSASVADTGAGVSIRLPDAGVSDSWSMRCKAAPTAPYTIKVFVSSPGLSGGDTSVGFGWADGLGATPKMQLLRLYHSTALSTLVLTNYTNPTTFSANLGSVSSGELRQWIAIRDDGSGNVLFYYSLDGQNYIQYGATIVKAAGFLGASGYSNVCVGAAINGSAGVSTLMSYAEQSGPP